MKAIAGIILKTPTSRDLSTELTLMLQAMALKTGDLVTAFLLPGMNAVAGGVPRADSRSNPEPLWNADRTRSLIFSGELFSVGAQSGFSQNVDHGRGALHLLGNDGTTFAALNGWFNGLLVDHKHKTTTLFNDRFGMGRVYFHESPTCFYFASEAKALLAVLPQTQHLNQQSLGEYISVGCVLQNRTLFRDVYLLPPGSAWTFHRDGRIEKRQYFAPSLWEQQDPLSASDYSKQLREVFAQIIPRYLRGPQPAGLSLTGGLDSRMVLAWAGAAPRTLPCYTFGGPYRDCADVTIARHLAKVTEQPHTILPIEADFFKNFSELAEETIRVSDGTMDVSGAVELYMNRKAVGIAPVRITGNYGSEILRSNVAFRPRRLDRTLYTPEFNRLLDGAEETYRTEAAGHRLSFIAFKQVPWHHYSRYSVEKAVLTPRSPFLDNDLVALAYRAPKQLEGSAEPLLQLIADGSSVLGRIASDRALRHGRSTTFAPLIQQWQEFTAKAEYAYDYGMPQWLARADRIVSRLHFERLFLGRHKFYHFRIWYREKLQTFAKKVIEDTNGELGCYRSGVPRKLVKDHCSGRANHTLDLHRVASLALIQRIYRVTI